MPSEGMTQGERIRALEIQVQSLENTVVSMDAKLDTLLAIRDKGMGAFWLASLLISAGILGFLNNFFHWVK